MAKKQSRTWISIGIALLVALALAFAFWPRPLKVDLGEVKRLPMTITIDEEAKTRVHDAYMVSAPIAGRLLRIAVEPGDTVEGNQSIIAHMLPSNPPALDSRSRPQATAAVRAAEAAVLVARADYQKMLADKELADHDLTRSRQLRASGMVSQAALDAAERTAEAGNAAVDMAKSTISVRDADLANARAQLISYGGTQGAATHAGDSIPLTAPVSGRVLRVLQKSETILAASTPILEIGNTTNDLEIVAELLSEDAVQVKPGNRVIVDNWGGPQPLNATVERIEPLGFTKVSALGVEEQRVNTIIRFDDDQASRRRLGHGYRVKVRIVTWADDKALTVPSSALFRIDGKWAVFVAEGGKARLLPIEIGHNNGLLAEILGGVAEGSQIVLYPVPGLKDGDLVAPRT